MSEPIRLELLEYYMNEGFPVELPDIENLSDTDSDEENDCDEVVSSRLSTNEVDDVIDVNELKHHLLETPLFTDTEHNLDQQQKNNTIKDSTARTNSPRLSSSKTFEISSLKGKWRKRESKTEIPNLPQIDDRLHVAFAQCETPTDVFLHLLRPSLENIIYQSNLYATQNNKTLQLSENEFLAFLGINFIMGYHVLPSKHHYWSSSNDLHVGVIADAMTRDRFDSILSCLHVNDNHLIPGNCTDRLYKLRPMIDTLNNSYFNSYDGTNELSIDETTILFKGRNSLKQYNPMKPIKRGYKVWCIADMRGYILNFDIYQGKNEVVKEEFSNFGLGGRVVLNLSKKFWGDNRVIVFDNYFSSLPLLEKLKDEKVLACATIKQNRKGLPENMIPDKQLKKGDFDYRISDAGISYFKWNDNKVISFISNYHGTEVTEVKRTQKDGRRKVLPCPIVVKDYYQFMGGVDFADRYRVLYEINRKSKKWWHRIFFALMDITFVNAFVIYNELFNKIPVLEMRRSVALGLITRKDLKLRKRIIVQSEEAGPPKQVKRRKSDYSVLKDVRLGNLGAHWPQFTEKRSRCEFCSKYNIESRPRSICCMCKVYLCISEKKNCFAHYHEINI